MICEIMNDDGTMARLPDLVAFAQHHNLKLGTIADLIAHRRRTERLVRRVQDGRAAPRGRRRLAAARLCQHARARRAPGAGEGRPRRRRGRCWCACTRSTSSTTCSARINWSTLHGAMRMIAAEGRGAVVLIRDTRPDARQPSGSRCWTAQPAAAAFPARLRHRRADPGRSRHPRHDPAVQHAADRGGAGGLRPQHRRAAADRRRTRVGMSTADAPLPHGAARCPGRRRIC